MAAFDFPTSPTVGDVSNGYVWDGNLWTLPAPPVATGIPDTPADGVAYARRNPTWVNALVASNNLSDIASAPAAIRNLGGIDLSTPILITSAVTLANTAFGKYHLISGATSYTITLPTPVGTSGALIAIKVDRASVATKLYTLTSPSGNALAAPRRW